MFRYRIAFVFGWTRESATIDADEEGREYKLIGGKIVITYTCQKFENIHRAIYIPPHFVL